MARPKGSKNKKKHVFEDPTVEEIVEVEVEFNCPVRGKVKQKVKMKKLKHVRREDRVFTGIQDIINEIEKEEKELSETDPDPEE